MSGVSGVGGPRNVSGIAMPEGVAMSPEAIIQMLMKEMGSIDGILDEMRQRIQSSTERVRRRNQQIEALRSILNDKDNLLNDKGKIDFSKLSPDQIELLAESGVLDAADLSEAYHYFKNNGDMERAGAIERGLNKAGMDVIPEHELPSELRANSNDAFVGIGTMEDTDRDTAVEALERSIQTIQDKINQINAGQDMMMIQFQDMMSRRSNRINMATNLLKKINDAQDAVVGNLR